jgi:hypothetical protein
MTAPTKDQLDRYMDLVVGGEEPEDAIAVIWADEKTPPLRQMVTEFPDGIVIGWDTCNARNGGCGTHVSKCKCKGGPKEPEVFAKWRAESSYPGQGALTVATSAPKAATTPAVASSSDSSSGTAAVTGQVPCREGKHFVAEADADKNDDGSYTCHACQEAGVQVDRS